VRGEGKKREGRTGRERESARTDLRRQRREFGEKRKGSG